MTSINNLKEFLELIKKHGATGILFIWLYLTHSDLKEVQRNLYHCLETRVRVIQSQTQIPITSDKTKLLAVLPKELKIKKLED